MRCLVTAPHVEVAAGMGCLHLMQVKPSLRRMRDLRDMGGLGRPGLWAAGVVDWEGGCLTGNRGARGVHC